MNKRIFAAFAVSVMLLSGCGGSVDINAPKLASKLASEGEFAEQLVEVSDEIAAKRLRLSEDEFTECIVYAGTNAVTDEIIIIKSDNTERAAEAVEAYLKSRREIYKNYRSDEVTKLDDAVIEEKGNCVIVCVSQNSSKAQRIIDDCTN